MKKLNKDKICLDLDRPHKGGLIKQKMTSPQICGHLLGRIWILTSFNFYPRVIRLRPRIFGGVTFTELK